MIAVVIWVVVPFLAGTAVFALGRKVPRLVAPVSVLGTATAFLAAVAVAGAVLLADLGPLTQSWFTVQTGGPAFDVALRLDGLTALVGLLVTTVALAVQVYSVAYLRADPRYPTYAAFVSLFTAAMLLVVAADDLLVLLVGWEVMGICSYFLIGHYYRRPEARAGALKAFVVTRLGDIGFLFGIFALAYYGSSFRISDLETTAVYGGLAAGPATLATLLLLCGVVGKSAQFPLHVWLPDAMPGPTPVSALIHAATMVAAGVFLVARLFPVFQVAPVTLAVIAVLAAVTMLGAAVSALAEDDIKRVLAWSTVSQLAYMLGGLAVGGYAAGLLHLLTHGAFKALLFLCAGVVIAVAGSNLMSAMGGMRDRVPVAFWTMTLGLAALIGLPPMSGFFSKDAVLTAAEHTALNGGAAPNWAGWTVLVVGFATVAVTAAYATRLWLRVFFGPRAEASSASEERTAGEGEVRQRHEAPALMRWPLVALAIPTVGVGFVALAPESLVQWLSGGQMSDAAVALMAPFPGGVVPGGDAAVGAEGSGEAALSLLSPVTTVISLVLVAAAGGAVLMSWRRAPAADPVWHGGRLDAARPAMLTAVDRFYDRVVVLPLRRLARSVIVCDSDVVDFYVQGAGRLARGLGAVLRRVQAGNVQVYLALLLVGVVVIVIGGAR